MRIAVAVLADAVNVRESMLNVLSGGVTQVSPSDYPAPLGVDLALMLELGKADLVGGGQIEIGIKVVDPDGNSVEEARGELGWSPSEAWSSYVPAPVPLSHVVLTRPGRYSVEVKVADLEAISMQVRASEVDAPPSVA